MVQLLEHLRRDIRNFDFMAVRHITEKSADIIYIIENRPFGCRSGAHIADVAAHVGRHVFDEFLNAFHIENILLLVVFEFGHYFIPLHKV